MTLWMRCHGDCEGKAIADLNIEQTHEAQAEASDLGLTPGEWPGVVHVDGFALTHDPSSCTDAVHVYRTRRGAVLTLDILND